MINSGILVISRPVKTQHFYQSTKEVKLNKQTKIVIGLGTFRRPKMLQNALNGLLKQEIPASTSVEIILMDNDPAGSAQKIFDEFSKTTKIRIHYFVERNQGIVFMRNRIIKEALKLEADYLGFVDDDEVAAQDWLIRLFEGFERFNADVTTGTVIQELPFDSPAWAIKSNAFRRADHRTGTIQKSAGTSSVLFDMKLCRDWGLEFHYALNLTGSSDSYFFEDAFLKGARIVWINEAIVTEEIPRSRVTAKWVWNRAYRYGNTRVIRSVIRNGWFGSLKLFPVAISKLCLGVAEWLVYAPFGQVHRIGKFRRIMSALGMINGFFGRHYKEYKQIHGH